MLVSIHVNREPAMPIPTHNPSLLAPRIVSCVQPLPDAERASALFVQTSRLILIAAEAQRRGGAAGSYINVSSLSRWYAELPIELRGVGSRSGPVLLLSATFYHVTALVHRMADENQDQGLLSTKVRPSALRSPLSLSDEVVS